MMWISYLYVGLVKYVFGKTTMDYCPKLALGWLATHDKYYLSDKIFMTK